MTPLKKSLPTTSYAVLGILSIHPMSGYELAQAAERSIANFWPISRSQVYSELARLEDLGLIAGADVAQERVPDKRVFEITPAGEDAFTEWVSAPGYEPTRMRLGFCLKTFFGHHMPRETMVENLERFKKENEEQIAYLQRVVNMLGVLPEAAFTRATAELGLRIARTSAQWAEELLANVPEIRHSSGEEHEEVHRIARELFRKVGR
ncbi:MAG TPA: PadR family transcriptional regulator [Actinomycetota bacterium]|nr:PadR family transcriptional regulator [Actinomycetota bacterium]